MITITQSTTKDEQRIAQSSLSSVRETSKKLSKKQAKVVKIKLQYEEKYIDIPPKAFNMLYDIMNNMALGKSITLIPSEPELTTQQAANMLHMSRPHMVKILEDGLIPYKKVGSHRRIQLKDIMKYEKKLESTREKQLAFLAKHAQELNLGY
jgi:excisionase family DNA binding protein